MKLKAQPGKPINSLYPIQTKPFPGHPEHDLTGHVFSGLTVVGYFGPGNDHGSQWVCQCKCGRYEVRRSKALKSQRPDLGYYCQACGDRINHGHRLAHLGFVAA